jgi:hypothetical protein
VANTIVSTAETLSVNFSPGQDVRFPTTSSESIFTFGDFRIQRAPATEALNITDTGYSFSNFATLESLSSVTFEPGKIISTQVNELNPRLSDPQSYAYFGSFYTKVASSINNVISEFPYAMLAYNFGTANTLNNYSNNTFAGTSNFNIPISALTNQGNVIFVSGASDNGRQVTLFDNSDLFGIQFSGNTANTNTYDIISYAFSSGSTGTLDFTINGILFTGSTTASTVPVYIRPSTRRYGQYKRSISNLEHQLLFEGTFRVPDPDDESTFITQTFEWPKTIDGFNPDSYGNSFEEYSESILKSSQLVDDAKTNIMIRTMIPENFLELDTDTQIYKKLLAVYSDEFDKIKQYIDSLAFSHTVTYDAQENVPDKFLHRLSTLLGFKFTDAFTDEDIFAYLASEDDDGKTFSDYNLDLWRRILVSINWMYKKKGTRDPLMFIFKLIGAPDCLINFDEFVYKINRSVVQFDTRVVDEFTFENPKVTTDGYPNYANSDFVFQEGGPGRGNGQDYINQWSPEFEPIKTLDNRKVMTGSTELFGTQNIINTKEIDLNINPASAIECDVKEWYQFGFGTWLWGSTGTTVSPFGPLPFSGLSVPFEWIVNNSSAITPSMFAITAMTISEWIDYVYANNVDPTNRKTLGKGSHSSIYISLKKIYMTYMLWTNNQNSNQLTFERLGKFLDLLERNFFAYVPQFIPATTIFDGATVYRNTVFNRQKFVYPEGLNTGSEFQNELPLQPEVTLRPVVLEPKINEFTHPVIEAFVISGTINEIAKDEIEAFKITAQADSGTKLDISAFNVTMDVNEEETLLISEDRKFIGTIITFPTPVTIVTATTSNG